MSELPSNFLVRELLDSTRIALRLTTPTSFWGILEDNTFCLRKSTSPLSKNATVRLCPVLCYSASHLNPNLRPWNVFISPRRFRTISVEHGGLCGLRVFVFGIRVRPPSCLDLHGLSRGSQQAYNQLCTPKFPGTQEQEKETMELFVRGG